MPVSIIAQTISAIPEAGHRGVDAQTFFVNKQEDFQDHLQGTTVGELNNLKTQINTTVGEINTAVIQVNTDVTTTTTKAGEASISANTATTKAGEASISASSASTSANKASQWADNNYNVIVESGKYSAKHWATVAQNTVAGKVDKVTSTDNAIVRFDGTTGAVQNSNVFIDDSGNLLLTSGTGGIGYGTGITVAQLTSKSTAVSVSKPSGLITMNSAALAAGASVTFSFACTALNANAQDVLLVSPRWGSVSPLNYEIKVVAMTGGGGAVISVKNISAGTLSEPLELNFAVVKVSYS